MQELYKMLRMEQLYKMNKKFLRQVIKEKRTQIDILSTSKILAEKILNLNEYKKSKNIMIFYPLNDEVNLLSLLEDKTKKFYLPRIIDKNLECCPYKQGDELCESCFHTLEPICKSCSKTKLELVIVPALACDKNNYRLGYGGGFYDRFLKDFRGTTICCIPKEFLVETVYPEEHDVKIDIILTN